MTNKRAPVIYIPRFFSGHEQDNFFAALVKLPWLHVNNLPRKEYYCNDRPLPYEYGDPRYSNRYEPQPYTPEILEIRARVEAEVKALQDVVFLNYYEDHRHHLGWHADDSKEMDPTRPISTVSLYEKSNESREIWARPTTATADEWIRDEGIDIDSMDPDERERLRHEFMKPERYVLEPGSLFIMLPGMQQTWMHRIPKSDRMMKGRISLTFRGYDATA